MQLTAPSRELKLANRELGMVESIIDDGMLRIKMDGSRAVALDPAKHPHLDHGYAVTSHSSQGQTSDRILIHVDTELGPKDLLDNRMAYVAVSRGAYDAQLLPTIVRSSTRRLDVMRIRVLTCRRRRMNSPSLRSATSH